MLEDCYTDFLYVLLSIPVIYILHVCSLLTKETTKRERDKKYCSTDIMELETIRYYLSNGDYKTLLNNIKIAAWIFFTAVMVILLTLIFKDFDDFNSMDYFVVYSILVVLTIILLKNIYNVSSVSTNDYDNEIVALIDDISDKNAEAKVEDSFDKLPDNFLLPFIERWLFTENKEDIKTFKNRIADLDNAKNITVEKLVALSRPYMSDTTYVYNLLNRKPSLSLPELSKYANIVDKHTSIEIIAWMILVFIYYNIFHHYYNNTGLFFEIIATIIISFILFLFMYYLVITKDTL